MRKPSKAGKEALARAMRKQEPLPLRRLVSHEGRPVGRDVFQLSDASGAAGGDTSRKTSSPSWSTTWVGGNRETLSEAATGS